MSSLNPTLLTTLSDLNLNTPGKICLVVVKETKEIKPLYSIEEFSPEDHSLILEQIWTHFQEILVRTVLEYLATEKPSNLEEIVKYQEILIEWLSSDDGNVEGILND